MAVDAQNLINNFSHDLFTSAMGGKINTMMMYNNNIAAAYGGGIPFSGTTTVESPLIHGYAANRVMQTKHQNQASMKDDSGLTYAIPTMMQRKRGRDNSESEINQQRFQSAATYQKVDNSFSHSRNLNYHQNNMNVSTSTASAGVGAYTFLGEDVSVQILQQQLDIDSFIYQHMEKVRMEINERRKRNSRRMIEVVEEGILKRLKMKEEEIEKIRRLNWALEERVRSLSVESQIWRELAQTNEATANALRSNLEQVLEQATNVRVATNNNGDVNNNEDDAESCCGSSSPQDEHLDNIASLRGVVDEQGWRTVPNERKVVSTGGAVGMCRSCEKAEACVVLLTCRHMCLCAGCGSDRTSVTCPVCKSVNDATLLVNL